MSLRSVQDPLRNIAGAGRGGPEPDLRQLRMFVTVAEELHFTRAAERLYVAQPALSAQIRQLEATLGVELFRRTTRKVELTEEGSALLAHAVPLLNSAARAWKAVADVAAGESAKVSFSFTPTLSQIMLRELVSQFHLRHPGIYARSLEVWWSDGLVDDLVDVAISRMASARKSGAASLPLFSTPLGLMLAHDHPLAAGDCVSIADLGDETLKMWPRAFSGEWHDQIMGPLRAAGFAGPVEEIAILSRGYLRGDPDVCADIAAGRAVSIGFREQYPDLEPEIVWREIAPTVPIPMHMHWRRDASGPALKFIEVTLDVAESLRLMSSAEHARAQQAVRSAAMEA